jgi:hypothetical protein
VRFDGDNFGELQAFVGEREAKDSPGYYIKNFDDAREYLVDIEPGIVAVVWDYLHQTWVGVRSGDYIIKGMKSEFYPCDPDVFHTKYELINEPKVQVKSVVTAEQIKREIGSSIQQSRRFLG